MRIALLVLALGLPFTASAQAAPPSPASTPHASPPTAAAPARIMLLGSFHFDNPGLDAVKLTPIDVTKPASQAYLEALAARLARFAPTRVVLEYAPGDDEAVNRRYAAFRDGTPALGRSELQQIGFRVARLAGLERVHGFDAQAPAQDLELWARIGTDAALAARFNRLVEEESRRQQSLHDHASLREILLDHNSLPEDLRNKGFYMRFNDQGVAQGSFRGADASADWWHRNLRMYARLQAYAQAGERVLVIAGSGHTAILRDFLRADGERVEEDVKPYI